MAEPTPLEQPLIIVDGKVQAFSARCLEHSTTVSAMLIVNAEEFRTLIGNSPALVAVLDRSMEFTSETLQFLQGISDDLRALSMIVIEEHERRAIEAALNQQETDRL